jgi:hypothetical protein
MLLKALNMDKADWGLLYMLNAYFKDLIFCVLKHIGKMCSEKPRIMVR